MLIFIDSADHYTTNAGFLKKWTSGTNPVGSAGNGRNGTQSIRYVSSSPFYKTIPSQSTYIVGFALRSSSTSGYTVISFQESSTTHVDVRMVSGGQLQVTRNGTVLATGTTALLTNVYYYIEFKANIHSSTGSYTLKINEVVELTASGVNTRNGGSGIINMVLFGGGGGTTVDIDDVYFCDTTGSTNNDFLGDIKIESLTPTSDSTPLTWAPSTGSTHYNLLDEVPPNDDTDYVTTSGVNFDDVFGFSNLTTVSGTVLGVQINTYDRKTDAGGVNILHLMRIGGIVYTGLQFAQQDTYIYHSGIIEKNPGTVADWTIADVNNAEFGIRRL